MGLADIMLAGGLPGIKRGMPRMAKPNATTPPFTPPQTAGNPIPLQDAPDGTYTPEQQDLRNLIANPPQPGVKPDGSKIGKFRRVMGEIAANVGPILGGPAVANLGQRLLNPGVDKWNADVQRAQALSQLSGQAEDRKDREANRKLMESNRQLMAEQRDAMRADTEQGALNAATKDATSATQLPQFTPDPLADLKNLPMNPQLALKPQAPTAVGSPLSQGLMLQTPNIGKVPTRIEDTIDPNTGKLVGEAGTVDQLPKPGSKGKDTVPVLRYNPATRTDMATATAKAKKQAELEAQQTEEITPEMVAALGKYGVPEGVVTPGKTTPTVYNHWAGTLKSLIEADKKPPATPPASDQMLDAMAARAAKAQGIALDPKKPALSQLPPEIAAKVVEDYKRDPNAAAAAAETRRTARGDRSYQLNSGKLDTLGKPIDDQIARFGRLKDTIAQGSMQADALIAPELLTVMAGGAGSGLRMNEAEISRIVGGRTKMEDLKALFQKWTGDPKTARSITPEQQQQISALVNTVHERLLKKKAILDSAYDELEQADDPVAHRHTINTARKQLTEIDMGSGAATQPAAIPQVGSTFQGGKVLKVTKVQ